MSELPDLDLVAMHMESACDDSSWTREAWERVRAAAELGLAVMSMPDNSVLEREAGVLYDGKTAWRFHLGTEPRDKCCSYGNTPMEALSKQLTDPSKRSLKMMETEADKYRNMLDMIFDICNGEWSDKEVRELVTEHVLSVRP